MTAHSNRIIRARAIASRRRGTGRPASPARIVCRGGSTLLEVLICVLIVGALTVPALQMLGSVAASYARRANRDVARMLAQDLLSEIKQADFSDPESSTSVFGIEPDETNTNRSDFDDVDDYHLWTEQPPQFRNGAPMIGYEEFTRTVEVNYVDPNSTAAISVTETSLLRVRVTVSHPTIADYVIEILRAGNGPDSVEIGARGNHVRRIGLQLELDGQPRSVISGAEIRNHVPLAN